MGPSKDPPNPTDCHADRNPNVCAWQLCRRHQSSKHALSMGVALVATEWPEGSCPSTAVLSNTCRRRGRSVEGICWMCCSVDWHNSVSSGGRYGLHKNTLHSPSASPHLVNRWRVLAGMLLLCCGGVHACKLRCVNPSHHIL